MGKKKGFFYSRFARGKQEIPSDVLGSYTGYGYDDWPVQDADDL